jgi:hypothetical protein
VLLVTAAVMMLLQFRKVRPADWLLLAAFGGAALTAQRNTAFVGVIAPVLIAGVWPWRWRIPTLAQWLFPALLIAGIVAGAAAGRFYRLSVAEWKVPKGAADFLIAHRITGPLFNSYEYGGYLMWRLWPQQKVFIDGRVLSESLFNNYVRVLYNHDNNDGQMSAGELLDRYGVQVIVMNTFEPSTGSVYVLAPALADPAQKTWKLVYSDPQALIFVRSLPADAAPMNSLDVFSHMESECSMYLAQEPAYPRCARSLASVFLKAGNPQLARRWLGVYLEHAGAPDPEAAQAYQALLSSP